MKYVDESVSKFEVYMDQNVGKWSTENMVQVCENPVIW